MEVEEEYDMTKICRTCLRYDFELKTIFVPEGSNGETNFKSINSANIKDITENDITISQMISACTIYPVKENDNYPNQICIKCIEKLKNAYVFKVQCEVAYEKLSTILNAWNEIDVKKNRIKFEKKMNLNDLNEKSTQTNEMGFYPCEKCEEKFFSYESLKHHRQDQHKGTENKCRICSKIYTRMTHLKRHISAAHPEIGYKTDNQCKFCNKRFTRAERLKKHINIFHSDSIDETRLIMTEEQRCKKCKILFYNDDDLTDHKCEIDLNLTNENEISIQTNLYEPEISLKKNNSTIVTSLIEEDNTFDSEPFIELAFNDNDDQQNDDMDTNDDQERGNTSSDEDDDHKPLSELKNQNKTTRDSKIFLDNGKENDKNEKGITKNIAGRRKKSKGKEHRCEQCDKVFTRSTHLKRHSYTHSDEKPFSCSVCKKGFTRLDHLNIHMHHHSDVKPYTCDICNRGFIRAVHLRKHKESRHGEKLITPKTEFCEICKKGFTTVKYLQIHMKSHTDRTWHCKICSGEFKSKPELTDHMKTHANEKPFLCSECGLRFVRNDYLVIHMRRHKGEKPYKCKFCGKGFPRATDLTVHERYHTGEKTHLCTVCGKGFQRAYNLLVHMRVHTGERPYQCPHCSKSFAQGNDLKAHVRRHTGERFKCEICGDGFIQGYHLTQHKRNVHGIDMKSHIRRVEKFTTPTEQQLQIHMQQLNSESSTSDNNERKGNGNQNEENTIQMIKLEQPVIEIIKLEEGVDSTDSVPHQTIEITSEEHAQQILERDGEHNIEIVDVSSLALITPVFLQIEDKVKYETNY